MSLDLYERETAEAMRSARPAPVADVGMFDGFVRGTGIATMRGLAKVGRAVDILGAVGPIAQDAFTGGTEAQDKYFQEHDEVWGSAVDFWTPKPREVGAAAEIAGTLLSTLPLVIAAPSLAIGSLQLSTAEDLVKKGVDADLANVVGATQAAGLGLGIYMPIFGQTLAQRVLAGGVGFNLLQGIGMRGAGGLLLEGTPTAEEFKALDPMGLTLDVLLGAAFGGIVHLSPTQRAHGAAMWKRMEAWGKGMKQSDLDALATLRQAQHLNADSMPGKPADPVDVERHAQRVRQAIEQLARNEPVDVTDLPAPRFEADEPRMSEMARRAREFAGLAEDVRVAEELPKPPRLQIPEGANLTPEQRVVEARARRQVDSDPEGQIRAYERLSDSDGGKVINVDIARELFPDYRKARWEHSPSVHEPASALMKELYARKLAEPDPTGLNMVTFTAGGTGAGKSSATRAVPLAQTIVESSQIVYDTNMANARSAMQKIDQALAAGKQATIVYVGVDPVEAFKRALSRAMKIGRTVPLEEHAKTHRGAAQAMEQLMEQYRGNDRVQFVFLDNSVGAKGETDIVDPDQAGAWLRSFNFDNLETRLRETLDAELQAGRISEEVHRGTAHALAEGPGAPDRRGGEEEPRLPRQAGGQGREGALRAEEVAPSPLEALRARLEEQRYVALVKEGKEPRTWPKISDEELQLAAQRLGIKPEALAASRGEAEPPPPRGSRGDEAAGAKGPDPLQLGAERFVAEQPDLLLKVGEDTNGAPILKTAKQYLDDAVRQADADVENVKLYELAANCMLGAT